MSRTTCTRVKEPGSQLALWRVDEISALVEVLDVPDWGDPREGLYIRFADDGEEFWVDINHVTPLGATAAEMMEVGR